MLQGETKEKNKIIDFIKQTFSEKLGGKMTTTAGYYFQEGVQQGLEQGIRQGALEVTRKTASNLLNRGMSIDDISEITGLPADEIKNLH